MNSQSVSELKAHFLASGKRALIPQLIMDKYIFYFNSGFQNIFPSRSHDCQERPVNQGTYYTGTLFIWHAKADVAVFALRIQNRELFTEYQFFPYINAHKTKNESPSQRDQKKNKMFRNTLIMKVITDSILDVDPSIIQGTL